MTQAGVGGRYCDRPAGWGTRLFGVGGTAAIALLALAGGFFTWTVVRPALQSSEPLVMELRPLANPPAPVRDVAPGPQQVERRQTEIDVVPVRTLSPNAPPAATNEVSEDTPPVDLGLTNPQTTALPSIPAPPAERLSNTAEPDWEAELLAHLGRFRRYPARARAARQQGTVHIRFRMNRTGAVLEANVLRSSGAITLDQAALDTFRRAQPLPAIPQDRPDTLELTVPVEFYLR